MTRRTMLTMMAGSAAAAIAAPPRSKLGLVVHSFHYRRFSGALDFLTYSHSLGAGGIQTRMAVKAPATLATLRDRAGEWDMYLEGMCSLPKTGRLDEFEKLVKDSKEVGALCLRMPCLNGRRYETFGSLAEWNAFVVRAKAGIARALPIAEKYKIPLAIENHKDWTTDDLLALLKQYESEYLGVTLDTGNNFSLLDDPMEHVRALAPYAFSTHLKDMGVAEYADGFLLAEVPFGEGVLDIPEIAAIIHRARPRTKMSLEMITRDPLKIPCLTERYWATFPHRNGRYLAHMLEFVRAHKPRAPLPRLSEIDKAARVRAEVDNVKQCLSFARNRMAL